MGIGDWGLGGWGLGVWGGTHPPTKTTPPHPPTQKVEKK